jgi:hypothetical protein
MRTGKFLDRSVFRETARELKKLASKDLAKAWEKRKGGRKKAGRVDPRRLS